MGFEHISVLLDESIRLLNVKPGGIYADGTLGGGGHASLLCAALGEKGTFVGIDRDALAIEAAAERLRQYPCKKEIMHRNFFEVKDILGELELTQIDGAILDLGVSSPQLDDAERGFSYHQSARLDMRMDRRADKDAYFVVNTYDERKLAEIISKYGEERYAGRIAREIVKAREEKPVETTLELSDIIKKAFPAAKRYADKHPAKRTFQAIRIEVNDELEGLSKAVNDFVDVLKPGGRLAVITFHSLEDRIVKQTFAERAAGCKCPKDFPVCVCGNQPEIKLVNRKPITAKEQELEDNFRAHSAKLRVIEKIQRG